MDYHLKGDGDGEFFELVERAIAAGAAEDDKIGRYARKRLYRSVDDQGDERGYYGAIDLPGHVNGARLSFNSVTKADIGTTGERSSVADSDRDVVIEWSGVLTADPTVAGAGGLQTGESEAADEWLSMNVIDDTTRVNSPAALLIPDGVAFLESGYDVIRRLGFLRNNGSSDFLKFRQFGSGRARWIEYDEENSVLEVLNAGTGSAGTFIDIDCSGVVPPTSERLLFLVRENNGKTSHFRPDGSAVSNPVLILQEFKQELESTINCPGQVFEYETDSGTVFVSIIGYEDDL